MNFLRVKVLSMWAVIPERYNLYVRRMSLSRELQRVKLIPLSGCQAPLVLSLFLSQSSSVALALIQPQMLSVVVWLGFVACSIIANCICIIRRHNVLCSFSYLCSGIGKIVTGGCHHCSWLPDPLDKLLRYLCGLGSFGSCVCSLSVLIG